MKKLIVVFLTVCFLLNIAGYHIIFYFRQQEIKAEMREAIRMQSYSEDETDFVFSVKDKQGIKQLDWEGDDEFSFKGEMYDVVEKKVENGKLVIRSVADKKETALLNKAKDHWNQNEKSNKVAEDLFQILQSLFHGSETEEVVFIKPVLHKTFFISLPLPLQARSVPTPPPKA